VVVDQWAAERHLRRRLIVRRLVRIGRVAGWHQRCDLDRGFGGLQDRRGRARGCIRDRCGDMPDLARDMPCRARDMAKPVRDVTERAHALAAAHEGEKCDEPDHASGYSKQHASRCAQLYRHLHNFTVAPAPHAWWP